MKIAKKTFKKYSGRVHDLTVEESHTYNVEGISVHNSAAGCLILFLIGVTEVDPLVHDLYFERFLSEARIKKTIVDGVTYVDGGLVPDVDLDLDYSNRHRVVEYLETKYAGKSCKLSTVSTLQGKILIKECGKIVAGLHEQKMNEVSSLVPSVFGKVKDLEEANKEVEAFRDFCVRYPEVYETALKLKGLVKNKSSHASGYLISYYPLEKYLPLELGSSDEVVSAYDMRDAQDVAIKVDLLGLQDVTLMNRVAKRVGEEVEKIDYNAPEIYAKLQTGIEVPYGLFQIGADCNLRVINKVKPRNLREVSVVIALARPGALAYVDQFAEYVATGNFQSVHPFFDDILQETGGIPVFQEQMMRMANKIGFSLVEADTLRRIVGKKKIKEMAEWEAKVQEKIKENNLDPKIGEVLWKVLDDSKSYSFNASHSISYALLSVASVYLKFKYPAEFFIESLKMSREKQDSANEISIIQKELQYFNIKLLPPDLVKSDLDFKKEGVNIRYGLSAIKGISDKTIEKLKTFINSDRASKYQVFQAAKKAGLNIGTLSALIQAGTLDSFGDNRPALVYEAQLFNILTDREKVWCLDNEQAYPTMFKIFAEAATLMSGGKLLFKPTRFDTIKNKKAVPYREIFQKNNKYPQFASYIYESKLLGYSYSYKLSDIFSSESNHRLRDILNVRSLLDDERTSVVGQVKEIDKKKSKKGNDYYRVLVEDESARQEFLIFAPDRFEKSNVIPKEDDIVILDVQKWNDSLTIQSIRIQTNKVYMKLGDLKSEEKLDK
jgi:DNA polymerase-3 subunit alpha